MMTAVIFLPVASAMIAVSLTGSISSAGSAAPAATLDAAFTALRLSF
jgi:hypothetical protein